MSEQKKGYVKEWRSDTDGRLYNLEPFDFYHAYRHLMLCANYENKYVTVGEERILIERGSLLTSQVKLMNRFKWSKEKLRRFFRVLEDEEKARTETVNRRFTVIHLLKYDTEQSDQFSDQFQTSFQTKDQTSFQTSLKPYGIRESSEDQTSFQTSFQTRESTKTRPVFRHKEEDKRIKEEEEERVTLNTYGEQKNVFLSPEDFRKLQEEFPELIIKEKIEGLSAYMMSTGKSYKNHYVTLRSWIKKDLKKTAPDTFLNTPETQAELRNMMDFLRQEQLEEVKRGEAT